jgi:N6-L-threonylcarbamoyladenine synthase
MEAHLLAPLLSDPKPEVPFVALLVSGGHNANSCASTRSEVSNRRRSIDDAAGEAFDKTGQDARPWLSRAGPARLRGSPSAATRRASGFRGPMTDRPGLDFSFSGLKTFTLNTLQRLGEATDRTRPTSPRVRRRSVVDTLLIKCSRALEQTGLSRLNMAGGVAAQCARACGARERLRATLLRAGGLVHRQRRKGGFRRLSAPSRPVNTPRWKSRRALAGPLDGLAPLDGRAIG